MLSELPVPDSAALAHSERLRARIVERVKAGGGWLSFADYMELALYEPGLGYYSAGAAKFGEAGDFVTAPELSPLFSRCLANQCAQVLNTMDSGTVLELGAGSGVMAADMLLEFERIGSLPEKYFVLEPSADLRERQAALIKAKAGKLVERVQWLESAPPEPIDGVVVANEVADALPVQRFLIEGERVSELGIALAEDELIVATAPAGAELQTAVDAISALPGFVAGDAYMSEICLRLPAWTQTISGWLNEGVALLFDYGFSRAEYYLPERRAGTLRCYYRHRVHDDPLLWPGLQDITAWVDFSVLAEAAAAAGMRVLGYTTQAQFLLAAGLDRLTAEQELPDEKAQVAMAHGLRRILLPGEMGESVKVLALGRGDVTVPDGMTGRDMRARL